MLASTGKLVPSWRRCQVSTTRPSASNPAAGGCPAGSPWGACHRSPRRFLFGLVGLLIEPQPLETPQHTQPESGHSDQRRHPEREAGGLLAQRDFDLFQVHLGHDGPVGRRNLAHRGQNRNPPIAHCVHRPTAFELGRCSRRKGLLRRHPTGAALATLEIAQRQLALSLPPQQQDIAVPALNRPGLNERIQRPVDVDPQNQGSRSGTARGHRNDQAKVDALLALASRQVRQHDVPGVPGLLGQCGVKLRGARRAGGHVETALTVHQNGVCVHRRLRPLYPCAHGSGRGRLVRPFDRPNGGG